MCAVCSVDVGQPNKSLLARERQQNTRKNVAVPEIENHFEFMVDVPFTQFQLDGTRMSERVNEIERNKMKRKKSARDPQKYEKLRDIPFIGT